MLKAIALHESGSWLRVRLEALRAAADEAARRGDPPPRKLLLFAHHIRVMDQLEATAGEALGDAEARARPPDGV